MMTKPSSNDSTPEVWNRFLTVNSVCYKISIISLVALVLIVGLTNIPFHHFESKVSKPTGKSADTEELPLSRPPLSCPPSSSFSSLSSKRAGKVLLMTYGRSGSTFTSSLISHHDNVFYTFEPLFIHHTHQLTPTPNNSVPILDEYLTCNFTREFIYAVESRHNSEFPDTKEIYQCLKQLNGIALLKCYATFQENCLQKQVKVVKTIRSRVEWAEWFLKTYPDFYLLYLVRDPRATIASQIKNFSGLNISVSPVICSQMKQDLAAAERLKSLYPDRVMGIRYENGAMDPFQYTRDIYKFLGLNYDNNTECHVKDLTMHDPTDYKRNTHAYEVFRENSTETMDKWRKTIPFEWVIVVDTLCGPLYSKLGYRTVETLEDLRSSKSLLTKPVSDSVFEK